MTRKDFMLIAAVIHDLRQGDGRTQESKLLDRVAEGLATALASTNPFFDRARFLNACR